MSTIIKPKRATQEEIAASTKVLSKDEILLAIPNEGDHSGKLKLYRGDGITPANELPVGIDGELGDDLKISAFEESTAEENQELEAGSSLSRLFGSIKRKFTQVQNETSNKVSSNGDISNTVIGSVDTITAEFPEPAAGESTKTYLGKVKKFIADFNSFKNGIITLGRLANNADTTVEGFALDARMGKTLGDRVAQLNSDLVEVNSKLIMQTVQDANLAIPVIPFLSAKYKIYKGLNAPVSGGYTFMIEAIGDSTTMFSQRAICTYTTVNESILGNMYVRHCNNGTWTTWEQIISNTDLQAGKGVIKLEIGKTVSRQISFPRPFSAVPAVTVNAETNVLGIQMHASNVTSSGFMAYASSDINADMSFDWIAALPTK